MGVKQVASGNRLFLKIIEVKTFLKTRIYFARVGFCPLVSYSSELSFHYWELSPDGHLL